MNYKLLVAEDISTEREALCRILSTHLGDSITIFEAENGVEALNVFQQQIPEIALLNIEMPGLSGLEVARKIRNSEKNCAIIFISDYDNFSYAKQAIDLRALDFILKPYDESKLILSVKEAMQYASHYGVITWNKEPQQQMDTAASPNPLCNDPRITLVRKDILNFIDAHYTDELSMKNVAHAMNYSDAYFCKLFKQCFQMNFSTYLNQYRIEKAKTMIENTRINVKDIGLACGYTDSNYFSRVFKRITGQTPTEYRLASMEKSLQT